MRIKYPENLYCPNCKATIKMDYSAKYGARTDDLLIMNIRIPESYNLANDARVNKQNIGDAVPKLLICQSCQTILGIYDYRSS
ncbi:MAG: hypothetical protein ACFFD4_36000 [Candidatus Odinarchaeota archaeon]